MNTTRTIILTPPGHPDCKISPGPWLVHRQETHKDHFEYRLHNRDLDLIAVTDTTLLSEGSSDEANATYIAECMGEAPAWEGWAFHIFGEYCRLKPRLEISADYEGKEIWNVFVGNNAISTVWLNHIPISKADIMRKALSWLLRAGCAKEVVS